MASLQSYLTHPVSFSFTTDRPNGTPLIVSDVGVPHRKLTVEDGWDYRGRLYIVASRSGAETFQSIPTQLDRPAVLRLRDHLTKMLAEPPAQAYPTSVASGGAGPTYVFSNPGTYTIKEG